MLEQEGYTEALLGSSGGVEPDLVPSARPLERDSAGVDQSESLEGWEGEFVIRRDKSFAPRQSMKKLEKAAYSVGHVMNDLFAACWFSYTLPLMINVHKLSPSEAGLVILSGQIADAICTPLVGVFSDASRGCDRCCFNLGKRKLFYLGGTAIVMVGFALLFGICLPCVDGGGPAAGDKNFWTLVLYMSAMAAFFNVGWASVQVSHGVFLTEVTDRKPEQLLLNSLKYSMTVFANFYVFGVFFWLKLRVDDQESQFRYLSLSCFLFGSCCTLLFFFGTTERRSQHFPSARQPSVREGSIRNSSSAVRRSSFLNTQQQMADKALIAHWKDWLKSRAFYVVGFQYMATRMLVNVPQVFVTLFIQDTLKLPGTFLALVPLTIYFTSFLSALAVKPLSGKISQLGVKAIGALLCLGSFVFFYLLNENHSYEIFIPAALLGLGNSFVMVCAVQFQADLVGKNQKHGAFVYGAHSFLDKVANGFAIYVLTRYDKEYITNLPRIAVGPIPALCTLIAVALSLFVPSVLRQEGRTLPRVVANTDETDEPPLSAATSFGSRRVTMEVVREATKGVGSAVTNGMLDYITQDEEDENF